MKGDKKIKISNKINLQYNLDYFKDGLEIESYDYNDHNGTNFNSIHIKSKNVRKLAFKLLQLAEFLSPAIKWT
jgi:hypothetical protein